MLTKAPANKFRSPLRYPGGKQRAIGQIANYFPSKAQEYREPLVGGGSVYFYARSINLCEKYWINDAFAELISFWQIVQNHDTCEALMKDLHKFHSEHNSAQELKKIYERFKDEFAPDNYRQAFLFFFFNRVSFSGTTKAGGFSSAASLLRFTQSSIERLKDMPEALANTKISNSDFSELIESPGDDVFVFLDPPYYTAKKLYGPKGSLHQFDHDKLANLLKETNHKFLITYDDCPEIRDLYRWANIIDWRLQYGMNNCSIEGKSKIGTELFISNY